MNPHYRVGTNENKPDHGAISLPVGSSDLAFAKVISLRLQTFSINFNHQNLILFQNICLLHDVLFSHHLPSLKFYSRHRISRIYKVTFSGTERIFLPLFFFD